jgi:hypothetical protein
MKTLKKIIVASALLIALSCSGCTDADGSRRVLEEQGYTNIRMTGYRWFSGGEHDVYATGFEATSPAGKRVTGTVTRGWMKNYTIRFD